MKQPSLGRIVHFVDEYGDEFAAIVVKAWKGSNETVNLFVFPNGDPTMGTGGVKTYVLFDESNSNAPRSWHWPEHLPNKQVQNGITVAKEE